MLPNSCQEIDGFLLSSFSKTICQKGFYLDTNKKPVQIHKNLKMFGANFSLKNVVLELNFASQGSGRASPGRGLSTVPMPRFVL
jgi:hypothetical protein